MKKIMKLTYVIGFVLVFMGSSGIAKELAKVNGRLITDVELKAALMALNEGQRENLLKDPNTKRQLLTELVDQEILVQEGEKLKLDKDTAYQEAVNAFRRQYLVSKLLESKIGPKLTDQAAKKYFETNKHRYNTDRVHVQHILARDEKTAKELFKKVKDSAADFQAIAEAQSSDPSAKNNRGDLGYIGWDSPFVYEFKEAAMLTKAGDIVGPIKTLFGYHIIKVVDKKIGKSLEFNEVELAVKTQFKQQLIRDFLGGLRKPASIQIHQDM